MNSATIIQLLLRVLPSLLLIILAFAAASDRKTCERWTELLYQAGSLRPEQRSDHRVQRTVLWPFVIMSVLFLIWPIRYYRNITRTIEIKTQVFSGKGTPTSPFGNPTPAANAVTAPDANSVTATDPSAPTANPPATNAVNAPVANTATPGTNVFSRPPPPPP